MAVESKSGGPGHNSGWYNHLIERKTQSVVGSLRQVQAALTVLDGMSKGVARVLNASRFKSIRACNVHVLSLSVEIVDLETRQNIRFVGSGFKRITTPAGIVWKHPYTRITRGKVKA